MNLELHAVDVANGIFPTSGNQQKLKCAFLAERALTPSLGVEYLFSVLRANGYSTTVIFDDRDTAPWLSNSDVDDDVADIAAKFDVDNCDVFFASVNTDYFARALSIIDVIKKIRPEVVTCVGGPHATYAHEHTIANECIDFLCRGEGEIAILEFLDFVQGKRVDLPSGIYRSDGDTVVGNGFGALTANLDSLPFPDKSDYYEAMPQIHGTYSIITGRGCFNKCTFCNSNTIRNFYRGENINFMRRRSVDDVITELRLAVDIYKPTNIHFCDDTFIFNKKYMAEFAERYAKEVGLPYFCSSTPNFFNMEILSKLAAGGLTYVEVGVQTLNETTRNEVFGRPETNEQFAKYVRIMKGLGVLVQSDHIINPWDSVDSLKAQINLYSEIKPNLTSVFYLMYYPSTAVIPRALSDGYVSKSELEDVYNGKLKFNYFRGSNMVPTDISRTKDLAVLLALTPWLPGAFTRFMLRRNRHKILKIIPKSIVFPLRFFHAILNKGDNFGRMHIRNLFRMMLHLKPIMNQSKRDEIQMIAKYKKVLTFEKATANLRPRKAS